MHFVLLFTECSLVYVPHCYTVTRDVLCHIHCAVLIYTTYCQMIHCCHFLFYIAQRLWKTLFYCMLVYGLITVKLSTVPTHCSSTKAISHSRGCAIVILSQVRVFKGTVWSRVTKTPYPWWNHRNACSQVAYCFNKNSSKTYDKIHSSKNGWIYY